MAGRGKDNLRALPGDLDQGLWKSSGWKKVGMHELAINSKVKLVYMKAIARVHPDKVRFALLFRLFQYLSPSPSGWIL
jgi:hypothetical protein